MYLEVMQHTLKIKQELDSIASIVDNIIYCLRENDLDELYASFYNQVVDIKVQAKDAAYNISEAYDKFIKEQ